MEKRQTCDLAGIWRFEIDKEDRGFAEHWEKRRLTQTITLPGCLQAQGYGDAISEDTPWVQSLYDAMWYQRGEYAYAIFDVEAPVSDEFEKKLEAMENIIRIRIL